MYLNNSLSVILILSLIYFENASSLDEYLVPVVDIESLVDSKQYVGFSRAISDIGYACRNLGFFYVKNHHISSELQNHMEALSREFFDYSFEYKNLISMKLGGKAWRGYFSVGEEYTSGIADLKEGVYFGSEKPDDKRYLHGSNLWPNFDEFEKNINFKLDVSAYMAQMKHLGQILIEAISESLGLPSDVFGEDFMDPTELFRIFNYPAVSPNRYNDSYFGVGEHTDYGFITILRQDSIGGLQVKKCSIISSNGVCTEMTWIDVPPIKDTFVINLGDALERATGGLLRATPHRVLKNSHPQNRSRISFPYFFDPSFESKMKSVFHLLSEQDQAHAIRNRRNANRWDNVDPLAFEGTYGQYLMRKVSKVFPELAAIHDVEKNSGLGTEALPPMEEAGSYRSSSMSGDDL